MTHIWLEYPETGGKAQFDETVAAVWRERGWVDTEPQAEPDTTKDPQPEEVEETPAEKSDDESVADDDEHGQDKPNRSGRRKRDSASEE